MMGHLPAQYRLSRKRISLVGTAAMDKAKYKDITYTFLIISNGSYGNVLGKLLGFDHCLQAQRVRR